MGRKLDENVGLVIDFRPTKERQRAEHSARYTMQGILALNPEEARDYFRCAFIMDPTRPEVIRNYATSLQFSNPKLSEEILGLLRHD